MLNLFMIILGLIFHIVNCSLFDNTHISYENGYVTMEFNDISDGQSLKIIALVEQPSLEFNKFTNCSKTDYHCLEFPENKIELTKTSDRCINVNLSTPVDRVATARVHFDQAHLFGGAEHAEIRWPLEKMDYEEHAYVTTTYYYQAIVEAYWLMSNGYYIYVDDTVPLFVSLASNLHVLTLTARKELPYVKMSPINSLDFVICKFQNARVAQLHAVNTLLGKPSGIPDVLRVKHPIWSTWVKFKESINENTALSYAQEIANHGYCGQIEIDDNWERCYGSLEPDVMKFSTLKTVATEIKKLNFRVTIWTHPFINENCEPTYSLAKNSGYLVKNVDNKTRMSWWRGKHAGLIDFTNPKASRWYKKRLETLKHVYNVDSFKFDGGESDYAPSPAAFHTMLNDHPHTYVKAYVKTISAMGGNVHTRVAKGTQKYPVFVTMMDRESVWNHRLGLYSVIPQVLQMNIIGYAFVLPDMIGGNLYRGETSEELFIRWVQVNTFLPSMQFSILPWEYGDRCAEITHKFVDLHHNYSSKIIHLMRKNVQTGAPVNPPIWWIAPHDPEALKCDNEFLLGEDTLIAPILIEGKTERDIYLPAGYWKDENHPNHDLIKGPTWLYSYEAPLEMLPYFTKVNTAYDIETLIYLHTNHYQNSWVVFIITILIVAILYTSFQIISRCLRLRKRVLTWYSKMKWNFLFRK